MEVSNWIKLIDRVADFYLITLILTLL